MRPMGRGLVRRGTAPLKSLAKYALYRRGYTLLADPFDDRLATMLGHLGVGTVIDGGANTGQFAHGLRGGGFAGRVLSVEPLSAPYEQLRAAAQRDPLWETERAALSDRIGTISINIAGNSVSSSALPMLAAHSDAAPTSRYIGTETAPTTTVDDLVARHGIDPAGTLLKLDVQGFEKTALAGATRTLEKLPMVQLELSFVPLYDGQWLARDVVDFLRPLGFELWTFDPAAMHDPATGRTLQCDGVFVRR